jgi:protein-tyrosine phosphatase
MAVALLERHLARAGLDVTVASAGLVGDGVPASPHAVEEMQRRGLDIGHHRSRRLAADAVRRADLVIGMARMHVREAVVLVPDAFPRSFTLRELVRRADQRAGRHAGDVAGWLATVGQERSPRDLLGDSAQDDVVDPIGLPLRAYAACADELDDLLQRLTGHLSGLYAGSPRG